MYLASNHALYFTLDLLAACPREPSISCEEDVYQDTSESAGTVHRKRTKTKKKDKRLADSPPGKLSQSLTATSFHQKRYNQLMEEMENFAGRMGDENSSQSSSSVDEEDDEIAELHRVWHIKELKDTRDRGKELQREPTVAVFISSTDNTILIMYL